MLSTRSAVSLVFASAVLLLFKSFTTGPGYATNCQFVSISCNSVVIVIKYMLIVHRGVRKEMNFVRLSHDSVTFLCRSVVILVVVISVLRYLY